MYLTDAATVTGHILYVDGGAHFGRWYMKGVFVMTSDTTTAGGRLRDLGMHLPDAPTPFGASVPAVQTGNLLFLSGMLATSGHAATVVGIVGTNLDVKAGREAAYTAARNVLLLTRKQSGSLDRVNRVVRLGVYMAATAECTEHPKVADAASELLRDGFGEMTVASRLVFGVASLPHGSAVELEVILAVKGA
jgi:enamine deaminase RidA (YjgF/YER057c/UK114 family)